MRTVALPYREDFGLPIDAVYTWVDGGEAGHPAGLAGETAPAADADSRAARRFRDNGELRYSLRSLERYAPWVRAVYLVSNGQLPAWLNRAHPRLVLVRHEQIFGDADDLPTFNSHAIEANLHRIPGLSARYLYLNDDVFFGSEATPADFIGEHTGQRIFLDSWPMPYDRHNGSATDRALAHSQELLNAHFGLRRRRAIAHTPQLYQRAIVEELAGIWPTQFRATSQHRFRAPDDLALKVLYFHFLIESRQHRYFPAHLDTANWARTYAFARLTGNAAQDRGQVEAITAARPKFFCINDDMGGDSGAGLEASVGMLKRFLESYFPGPSGFEISAGGN